MHPSQSVGLYVRDQVVAMIEAVYLAAPADVDTFRRALLVAFESQPAPAMTIIDVRTPTRTHALVTYEADH